MFHVKPRDDTWNALGDLICSQADLLGVEVDELSCGLLLRHLEHVLRANRSFNLTTITDSTEAVRLHVVDSLVAVPEIVSSPSGRLADIGAGAGYPGIPLALLCHRSTTLFESNGKKSTFLREVVRDLAIEERVEIAAHRSEELAEDQRGRSSIVTARAVSSLPSLLELASPLLQMGGRLVAYKGVVTAEERSRGEAAAGILGFESYSERRVFLPTGGEERTIITYAKIAEPGISLPRRPGLAQRRPLA